MKVIGLRIEKYIDKAVSGHNCNFTYTDAEFERRVICGVLSDNRKVEITLSHSEGECGSGWCCASYGHIEVMEVQKFNSYTHVPKKPLIIDDYQPGFDGNVSNLVFTVDDYGGDHYYPSGYYDVNMDLFKETGRTSELRKVWIFTGPSNSGKSYLSSRLSGLDVYETDQSKNLPKTIISDIIVLGNKHEFTIDEVKSKVFGEAEIIIVNFN